MENQNYQNHQNCETEIRTDNITDNNNILSTKKTKYHTVVEIGEKFINAMKTTQHNNNDFKIISDRVFQIYKQMVEDYGDTFSELFKEYKTEYPIIQIREQLKYIESLSNKTISGLELDRLQNCFNIIALYSIMASIEIQNGNL